MKSCIIWLRQKMNKEQFKYVIINKPFEVLCQFSDLNRRPTLKDYIDMPNIYSVGRLDYDSEGLLFLTDDGKLNQMMSNPRYKIEKTYWAQVEGIPSKEALSKLEKGVMIGGKKTLPAKVKRLPDNLLTWPRSTPIRFRKSIPTSWLEITIHEGRNRQVRKMTAAVGLPCLRLIRVKIGPIKLGNLKPGEYAFIKKPHLSLYR